MERIYRPVGKHPGFFSAVKNVGEKITDRMIVKIMGSEFQPVFKGTYGDWRGWYALRSVDNVGTFRVVCRRFRRNSPKQEAIFQTHVAECENIAYAECRPLDDPPVN